MKRIVIIGTGYVGLVTGACLAKMGHSVICLDIDEQKIASLRRGIIPFYEPGLTSLVRECSKEKRLFFTDSYKEALSGAELCFFSLPTPSDGDGSCNLTHLLSAAREAAHWIETPLLVINKSTTPVGTTLKLKEAIASVLSSSPKSVSFEVVSNPEFLSEGTALTDCLQPERIVIGAETKEAFAQMSQLYAPLGCPILEMDIPSAELTKYVANAMLGLRISFMNEMSILTETLGGDISLIQKGIGADSRIGSRYLNPGIGFGGSCLPKDIKALSAIAKEIGNPSPLLEIILKINENQNHLFFKKITSYFGVLEGKTLAIWGLSFKPDTDDLREAPSMILINKCLEGKATLRLYDPQAMDKLPLSLRSHPHITLCSDPYEAAQGAHGIALVTDWSQFKSINLKQLKNVMKKHAIFDGRNLFHPETMAELGFDYFCIGKQTPLPLLCS